jgi:hypothetical protein
VELVFTAHPTQAFRQSLLKKYAAVRRLMDKMHTQRMSPYERLECLQSIKAQVRGMGWGAMQACLWWMWWAGGGCSVSGKGSVMWGIVRGCGG